MASEGRLQLTTAVAIAAVGQLQQAKAWSAAAAEGPAHRAIACTSAEAEHAANLAEAAQRALVRAREADARVAASEEQQHTLERQNARLHELLRRVTADPARDLELAQTAVAYTGVAQGRAAMSEQQAVLLRQQLQLAHERELLGPLAMLAAAAAAAADADTAAAAGATD
jgi:hypothetical protein